MPRATTKDELLTSADANYTKFLDAIDGLSDEQIDATFEFEDRDRNVRDIVAHLVAWHGLMRNWYDVGMAGDKPEMPAKGYTWQTIGPLNLVFWEEARSTPLETTLVQFAESHQDMMRLIEAHTDEELFTKKYYKWTGTTSLGAYFVSATASHYDWALKKLRKAKKAWG